MLKKSLVTSLSVSALLLTAAHANAEENKQSEDSKAPTNVLADNNHSLNGDKTKASSDKVSGDAVSPVQKSASNKADDKKASVDTKNPSVASTKPTDNEVKSVVKGTDNTKAKGSNVTTQKPAKTNDKAAQPTIKVKVDAPKTATPKSSAPKNVKPKSTATKTKETSKATSTSAKKDVKTVKTNAKKDDAKVAVKPANTKVAATSKAATVKTDKANKADQKVKATQKKAKQLPKTGSEQSGVLVSVASLFIAGLTLISTRLFRSRKSNI